MSVEPEVAAPPAREQDEREDDDQAADRRLRRVLHRLREVRAVQHHRDAEDKERRRVPEPPGQAEARGMPGRPASTGGDHGRHRRQVIGIAGVPQAEQDRDRDDDEQRRAVRKPGDVVVEAEHVYVTFGKARTVIATPAARITRALTAGSSATTPRSKLSRLKAPRASTAAKS